MSTTPDHVYLDLSIVNDDVTGTGTSQNLFFSETRNTPIIDNPKDYYMSVIRFTLDTPAKTLPIFIPSIDDSPTNNDPANLKTNYYVTISSGNDNKNKCIATVPVTWSPEDVTQRYTSDYPSPYYYCWSVRWFLELVNRALALAIGAINANLIQKYNIPYITFDVASSTFSLLVPSEFYSPFSIQQLYGNLSLWFNEPLMNLFSSFSNIYIGTKPYLNQPTNLLINLPAASPITYPNILATNPGVCAYLIFTPDEYGVNKITITPLSEGSTPLIYYEYQQEYPSIAMWNPISSIVFTSTALPIVMSQSSPPEIYNDTGNIITGSGNNSQIIPLISDFVVPLTTGLEYKPNVNYSPVAEYRLIDLLGNSPINNVNFSVYWKDKYGNIIPFQLSSQCSSSLKILFRKKGLAFKGYNM